jgi:hypothetical protein
MSDDAGSIHKNISDIKEAVKEAKLSAELAGVLTLYSGILDKIKDKSSTPSAPGSPPKSMSGDLVEGLTANPPEQGKDAELGFKKPAENAHLLEFGTPRMLPRPFFRTGFEEAQLPAQQAMEQAFEMAMSRGRAHAVGMVTPGSQEQGNRYHQLRTMLYFDIRIEFWREGEMIGYSFNQGGNEILKTGWNDKGLPGGVTFNDLVPNAVKDAKQVAGN